MILPSGAEQTPGLPTSRSQLCSPPGMNSWVDIPLGSFSDSILGKTGNYAFSLDKGVSPAV